MAVQERILDLNKKKNRPKVWKGRRVKARSFQQGCAAACFWGHTLEVKLLVIIVLRTYLRSRGGIASKGEPDGFILETSCSKRERETGLKWSNTFLQGIKTTCSKKKWSNFLQTLLEASLWIRLWTLRTEFSVLKWNPGVIQIRGNDIRKKKMTWLKPETWLYSSLITKQAFY